MFYVEVPGDIERDARTAEGPAKTVVPWDTAAARRSPPVGGAYLYKVDSERVHVPGRDTCDAAHRVELRVSFLNPPPSPDNPAPGPGREYQSQLCVLLERSRPGERGSWTRINESAVGMPVVLKRGQWVTLSTSAVVDMLHSTWVRAVAWCIGDSPVIVGRSTLLRVTSV